MLKKRDLHIPTRPLYEEGITWRGAATQSGAEPSRLRFYSPLGLSTKAAMGAHEHHCGLQGQATRQGDVLAWLPVTRVPRQPGRRAQASTTSPQKASPFPLMESTGSAKPAKGEQLWSTIDDSDHSGRGWPARRRLGSPRGYGLSLHQTPSQPSRRRNGSSMPVLPALRGPLGDRVAVSVGVPGELRVCGCRCPGHEM